jgi:hypothetical protein
MPPASKRAAPALDALQDVLADAFGRVMRRELADCEKPVRKLEETRDGEAFDAWKARFASDHADFTSKTIAPALRAVEKMADLAPGTLENWGEKWQSETLDGLTEARNGDHPAEKWAEKVDEWRSNRAVSWAEIVLEQAEMARKEAA